MQMSKTIRWILPLGLVLFPVLAQADVESLVAFGAGIHTTIHREVEDAGTNTAGVGAQIRLKLAEIINLKLDYDFAQSSEADTDAAETLAQLVPYPDVRMGLGVSLYPNAYLSPQLCVGGGFNTGAVNKPVLFVGFGLETTLFKHWVIGATGQIFYATPGRYMDYSDRKVAKGENVRIRDFLVPHVYQVSFEVTYYI